MSEHVERLGKHVEHKGNEVLEAIQAKLAECITNAGREMVRGQGVEAVWVAQATVYGLCEARRIVQEVVFNANGWNS